MKSVRDEVVSGEAIDHLFLKRSLCKENMHEDDLPGQNIRNGMNKTFLKLNHYMYNIDLCCELLLRTLE